MYEYAEPVTMEYDAGLRAYLTSIYNWMMAGLAISAVTSYLSRSPRGWSPRSRRVVFSSGS